MYYLLIALDKFQLLEKTIQIFKKKVEMFIPKNVLLQYDKFLFTSKHITRYWLYFVLKPKLFNFKDTTTQINGV